MDKIKGDAVDFDMTGLTVVDFGGYDGHYAKGCADRGAASATVVDSGEWREYAWSRPHPPAPVEYVEMDLMDWREPADVILLYNVLYHLSAPLPALQHLRSLCRKWFVICCPFVPGSEPVLHIHDPLAEGGTMPSPDVSRYTCYFRPTRAGLERLLAVAGFQIVETFGPSGDHVVHRCRPTATLEQRWLALERAKWGEIAARPPDFPGETITHPGADYGQYGQPS